VAYHCHQPRGGCNAWHGSCLKLFDQQFEPAATEFPVVTIVVKKTLHIVDQFGTGEIIFRRTYAPISSRRANRL
jgi:hypothetical protein